MTIKPLEPSQLYKPCKLEQLTFTTTDELDDVDTLLGQDRAIAAIKFGLRIDKSGYNIFALAPDGTGKMTTIKQLAEHEPAGNRRRRIGAMCTISTNPPNLRQSGWNPAKARAFRTTWRS